MYSLDPAGLPPSQIDLSRRAAQRYATLTAVQERAARPRLARRRRQTVPALPHRLVTDGPTGSSRC